MRTQLDKLLQDHKSATAQFKQEQQFVINAENNLFAAEEAQKLIQMVAQVIQQQAHEKIAGVVTRCLEAVFDEPYQFKIKFEQARGRTQAKLVFCRDGMELENPLREIGGGAIDVAAFGLRLACLMLSKPQLRRVLILDEPFSKIRGRLNRQRVRGLVVQLADELGVQFVLCIDVDVYTEFEFGTVIQID